MYQERFGVLQLRLRRKEHISLHGSDGQRTSVSTLKYREKAIICTAAENLALLPALVLEAAFHFPCGPENE